MKSKITSSVFLILCLLTSCSKDEMELLLETPEQTDYLIDRDGHELSISVASNAEWVVSVDAEWLTVNRAEGTGNADVTVNIGANPVPERRYATISVCLKRSDKMFAVNVVQNGASRLLGMPSVEKGQVTATMSVRATVRACSIRCSTSPTWTTSRCLTGSSM